MKKKGLARLEKQLNFPNSQKIFASTLDARKATFFHNSSFQQRDKEGKNFTRWQVESHKFFCANSLKFSQGVGNSGPRA